MCKDLNGTELKGKDDLPASTIIIGITEIVGMIYIRNGLLGGG
jgi:hypothetical protein